MKTYTWSIGSGVDVKTWQMKTVQHQHYSVPRSESEDAPIEGILGSEMKSSQIQFTRQAEIYVDQKLFTVPDFYIEKEKILVYCDGSEFHSSTQRIMNDKTQDRELKIKGYLVLRFTGSEIFGDVKKCVKQILEAIEARKSG